MGMHQAEFGSVQCRMNDNFVITVSINFFNRKCFHNRSSYFISNDLLFYDIISLNDFDMMLLNKQVGVRTCLLLSFSPSRSLCHGLSLLSANVR